MKLNEVIDHCQQKHTGDENVYIAHSKIRSKALDLVMSAVKEHFLAPSDASKVLRFISEDLAAMAKIAEGVTGAI